MSIVIRVNEDGTKTQVMTLESGTVIEREIRSFPATINGETREVEAVDVWGDAQAFDTLTNVALFSKGRGGKLWKGTLRFWRRKNGSYSSNYDGNFLNRSGYRAIRFNDEEFAQYLSQHNTSGQG
jgi:hypothetical protein